MSKKLGQFRVTFDLVVKADHKADVARALAGEVVDLTLSANLDSEHRGDMPMDVEFLVPEHLVFQVYNDDGPTGIWVVNDVGGSRLVYTDPRCTS